MATDISILPRLHLFEFCDRVEDKDGKKSLHGIFSKINVLFFPSIHPEFMIVIGFSMGRGIFNGKISLNDTILSNFDVKLENTNHLCYYYIAYHDIEIKNADPLIFKVFLNEEIVAERIIEISKEEIPDFSQDEIVRLLKDPNSIKKARAVFECPLCKTQYTLQLNLDHSAPVDEGTIPFPDNNWFKCPKDNFQLDITGMRMQLKKILGSSQVKKEV